MKMGNGVEPRKETAKSIVFSLIKNTKSRYFTNTPPILFKRHIIIFLSKKKFFFGGEL